MFTVGQDGSALLKVKKEALGIYRLVNKYCPQFQKTKDIRYFQLCWQKIIWPYFQKTLNDALKIYVLGSKLESLAKVDKQRAATAKKYSAARFQDRPEMDITVTEWVRRFCTPKAQRGIPLFLKECWGRYPGPKMTYAQFKAAWSANR